MGFLQRNTVAVTNVYIFVVLHNEHTFTIFCNSFSPPPPVSLSHTCRGGFRKVCVVLFNDFVFTNFVILIIFFRSGMYFYCVKLIFSLQWYSLKWNIFTWRYIVNWWGPETNFVLLNISLLRHSLEHFTVKYLEKSCVSPTRKQTFSLHIKKYPWKQIHAVLVHRFSQLEFNVQLRLHLILLGQLNHGGRDDWDMGKQEIRQFGWKTSMEPYIRPRCRWILEKVVVKMWTGLSCSRIVSKWQTFIIAVMDHWANHPLSHVHVHTHAHTNTQKIMPKSCKKLRKCLPGINPSGTCEPRWH
jgi:hypothetical protein